MRAGRGERGTSNICFNSQVVNLIGLIRIRVNTMASKQLDLTSLLEQTFFGLNTLSMLGDVEGFIEFSENNIELQKHRELRRTEQECSNPEFDDPREEAQYRTQLLEGVKFRFEVSLTQRVRYAALVALITTIEWVLLALKKRASFKFPKTPNGKNEAVHILSVFNSRASLSLDNEISSLEALIYIRNCIVHAAGLLTSCKHEPELRQTLETLTGIKVSDLKFLGDSIEIETGFLEGVIKDVRLWLPNIEKVVLEQDLLRKQTLNPAVKRACAKARSPSTLR